MAGSEKVRVSVGGRTLSLSNLEKVIYPSSGWTKADVIDYYASVGPTMAQYVAGRPVTFKRYPDGVDGQSFFEKNTARNRPEWLHHAVLQTTSSTRSRTELDYAILDDVPGLVWAANLAALELHVPQWRVGSRGQPLAPDLLVLDLDPGPPATIVECATVAKLLRERLRADGVDCFAKTSGSKGMQLYAGISVRDLERPKAFAKRVAEELAAEHRDLVVSRMDKKLRAGKVLIDWSQNHTAKTTVAPYSLRARDEPTVSTPVTWDEVDDCTAPEALRFLPDAVRGRLAAHGDLFDGLLKSKHRLP